MIKRVRVGVSLIPRNKRSALWRLLLAKGKRKNRVKGKGGCISAIRVVPR